MEKTHKYASLDCMQNHGHDNDEDDNDETITISRLLFEPHQSASGLLYGLDGPPNHHPKYIYIYGVVNSTQNSTIIMEL